MGWVESSNPPYVSGIIDSVCPSHLSGKVISSMVMKYKTLISFSNTLKCNHNKILGKLFYLVGTQFPLLENVKTSKVSSIPSAFWLCLWNVNLCPHSLSFKIQKIACCRGKKCHSHADVGYSKSRLQSLISS